MLKLGLCGWLPSNLSVPTPASHLGEVCADTLCLVERLIGVVRRRRSPKAVETYEQVLFLVEYIEYLRQKVSCRTPVQDVFADWDTHVE